MIARGALTIACVAVAGASLGSAVTAEANWSRPVTVARVHSPGSMGLGAYAGQGAAVGWVGDDPRVVAVRRLGGRGALGAPRVFSSTLEDLYVFPRVAVAASGAIVACWSTWDRDRETGEATTTVFARRMRPGGKLGPVRTIARLPNTVSDSAAPEQFAMDARGNATIAWIRGTDFADSPRGRYPTRSSVRLRRFNADGTLGPIVEVPSDGARDFGVSLAVEPSGRGALSWVRGKDDRYTVRATLLDRAGGLRTSHEVSASNEYWSGNRPRVALRNGRATIAWAHGVEQRLYARQLTRRGLGPLATLTEAAPLVDPAVVVDGFGTATIAWTSEQSVGDGSRVTRRVEARRFAPGGALGPLRVLSPADADVGEPMLAADGLGNTTVLWMAKGVRVRRFSRRGRLGRVTTLARGVSSPEIAADAAGVFTVAWETGRRGRDAIRVSRFVP